MLSISARTRVVALLGYPLDYNLTAALLNAGFDAAGKDFTCIPFEVKSSRLPDAVRALKALGMAGANVAMPHKEAVVPLLDRLGHTATLVGRVDTVGLENGQLVGHNSDFHAFLYALREAGGAPKDRVAVLLGAGGTSAAIACALLKEGAREVRLINRTRKRAEDLRDRLLSVLPGSKVTLVPWDPGPAGMSLKDADLLINAVPGDPQTPRGPLFLERDFHPGLTVFDAGWSLMTPLLMGARRAGCTAVPGTRMLLWHAVMSQRLWTLKEAPIAAMDAAIRRLVEGPGAVAA